MTTDRLIDPTQANVSVEYHRGNLETPLISTFSALGQVKMIAIGGKTKLLATATEILAAMLQGGCEYDRQLLRIAVRAACDMLVVCEEPQSELASEIMDDAADDAVLTRGCEIAEGDEQTTP